MFVVNSGKKKLLILVDWFAPGYKAGGPIQSCVNVSFLLKDEYELYVLTSDRDFGDDKPYPGIKSDVWSSHLHSSINVFYASSGKLNRKVLIEIIRTVDPDFIYLNHLFSRYFVVYPLWLKLTGHIRGKVILSPRGALYESALSIKSYKKLPFLTLFKWMGIHKIVRFHATNYREEDAILRYFPGSEVFVADNLPNSRQQPFESTEKNYGLLKCIFVARVHPIKNLLFFLKLLAEVKAEVQLTIIGPLEDENYWKLCEQAIIQLPSNISVKYVGSVPNEFLHRYIVSNHIFVSTTTGENFGHAIFESFLSGRPVLISDQTPWQALQSSGIGWELPLSDLRAFVRAVETAAAWDQGEFEKYAKAAWEHANRFINDNSLKSKYLKIFS
jgi:glycosyltransferase involved in cell wall biosynthesis